jgi:probable phosphoglycerate mutase
MSEGLKSIYVVRHGETVWSLSGQHTGLTDLPLTPRGEQNARWLRGRLARISFAKVFRSPLQRATRTCELAGFGEVAEADRNLVEWNYGEYEGLRTAEIHARRPGWKLFRDGCPGGEMPEQVAGRADAMLRRAGSVAGNVLLFSSGHFLRMLTVRWLGLDLTVGNLLLLDPASISILEFEGAANLPVLRVWNDTYHLAGEPGPAK